MIQISVNERDEVETRESIIFSNKIEFRNRIIQGHCAHSDIVQFVQDPSASPLSSTSGGHRRGAPETNSVRVSATTTPPAGQTRKWKGIVKRSYESVTDNTYIFYATYFDANDDFIF